MFLRPWKITMVTKMLSTKQCKLVKYAHKPAMCYEVSLKEKLNLHVC